MIESPGSGCQVRSASNPCERCSPTCIPTKGLPGNRFITLRRVIVNSASVPVKPDGSTSFTPPSGCSASWGLGAAAPLKTGTPRQPAVLVGVVDVEDRRDRRGVGRKHRICEVDQAGKSDIDARLVGDDVVIGAHQESVLDRADAAL